MDSPGPGFGGCYQLLPGVRKTYPCLRPLLGGSAVLPRLSCAEEQQGSYCTAEADRAGLGWGLRAAL